MLRYDMYLKISFHRYGSSSTTNGTIHYYFRFRKFSYLCDNYVTIYAKFL